jgi:hypothetical protein
MSIAPSDSNDPAYADVLRKRPTHCVARYDAAEYKHVVLGLLIIGGGSWRKGQTGQSRAGRRAQSLSPPSARADGWLSSERG